MFELYFFGLYATSTVHFEYSGRRKFVSMVVVSPWSWSRLSSSALIVALPSLTFTEDFNGTINIVLNP